MERILSRIENDPFVGEEFKNIQTEKLLEIFNKYLNEEIDENMCLAFYKEINLSYPILYRILSLLRDEFPPEKLDYLLNLTAKIYIKKELMGLKGIITQKEKYDFLLFDAHTKWLSDIIYSIKNEELDKYPLIDAEKCKFNNYLSYLESLMICLDVNLCVYLHDLHGLIHSLSASFYRFYKEGLFSEAYFIFKDLKEQILRFYNTLNDLYIATFSNQEKSFFDLLDILVKSKTLYVGMLDLKGLKQLSKELRDNEITSVKKIIYTHLHKLYKSKKNYLFIKGVSNDFYFLGVDIDYEEFENELNRLREEILKISTIDVRVVGIKVDRYLDLEIKDIIDYLNFLKDVAKRENKSVLVNNRHNHFKEWVKTRVDISFIKDKIENKEVEIVFQPIFCEKTKIFSLEVLGRIKDNNGLIPAGIFIDKIYELNLIDKFDSLVLDKLVEKEKYIKQISDRVFLNISFEALKKKEYKEKLIEVLNKIDLKIVLELTEQTIVENLDLLKEIQKEGIYFAVDDFGSGYSSLILVVDLLRENMIDVVKIDGTLIKNLKNDIFLQKVVKIISQFRKEFDLHIVAEFVEDKESVEFLEEAGIDLLQGYYLSMPKTIEELISDKTNKIRNIIK